MTLPLSAEITGVGHQAWFYMILVVKPRPSCMLGKHFTH